ncbi:MAG: PrsW family glutamic-type intramembrane protease [Candidatus Pacebacteria bacterium]|nr:PrsW family glutamic-type intramembrane protease [Candidatus Paceibacterota bacterium]
MKILFIVLLSIAPIAFWFWFYLRKRYIPSRWLLFSFISGMGLFVLLSGLENKIIPEIFPSFSSYFLKFRQTPAFNAPLSLFLFSFFLIAPLEEIPKFLILKKIISTGKQINQIADGLQLGLCLGLGFALGENILHLSLVGNYAGTNTVFFVFALRFFVSTVAQICYSGAMGYYLALGRFRKIQRKFLWGRALLVPIIIHGLFNLFIFSENPAYSVITISLLSFLLYKWQKERETFEIKIPG